MNWVRTRSQAPAPSTVAGDKVLAADPRAQTQLLGPGPRPEAFSCMEELTRKFEDEAPSDQQKKQIDAFFSKKKV